MAMAHTMVAGFTGMTANQHSGSDAKSKKSAGDLSDIESDEDNSQYPEIATFFQQLMQQDPRRNLAQCADALCGEDYFNINEIADKHTDFFTKSPFYLSNGNADFVVKKVRVTVEKIKKGRK